MRAKYSSLRKQHITKNIFVSTLWKKIAFYILFKYMYSYFQRTPAASLQVERGAAWSKKGGGQSAPSPPLDATLGSHLTWIVWITAYLSRFQCQQRPRLLVGHRCAGVGRVAVLVLMTAAWQVGFHRTTRFQLPTKNTNKINLFDVTEIPSRRQEPATSLTQEASQSESMYSKCLWILQSEHRNPIMINRVHVPTK